MYVCPCIIYENVERYQLDVKILFIIINNSTCFGHLHDHLQEYIGCILLHMVFSTFVCNMLNQRSVWRYRGNCTLNFFKRHDTLSPTCSTNAENLRSTGYLLCVLTCNCPCTFKLSAGWAYCIQKCWTPCAVVYNLYTPEDGHIDTRNM